MTRRWTLRCVYEYGAGRCTGRGEFWLGQDVDGVDGWVCEKHLQYTSDTDTGMCLHSRLADARAAQATALEIA